MKIPARKISVPLRLCGLLLLFTLASTAQVPAPKDVLGWTPGDDRKLASWAQVVDYFKKLDAASDRVMFEEIGKTTMGAPFVYATISSFENLQNLEKYKKINAQLADPRTFKSRDKFAERLIEDGKTIVLITCGIHSTEVGGYLSSMLIAHRLASSNEPEIQKILNNTIILLVPSLNPDGVDVVNNWYQKTLGTPYEGTDPPELYHKYVGHDNNRDWYAFTQVETQLTVDKIHNVWHPQIVHDIHQQGANGSRIFLPPYMQPVEPNVPKQLVEGYTELGNAVAADLRAKGFQGITTNSTYDAWTPSRAYSHYHGGVRILSETASARLATPITVKFSDLRPGEGYDPRVESANFGPVWRGGEWHIRDITNYMTTAAFSLLNNAADNREKWLARFYEIGKEAVRPRKEGELVGLKFSGPKTTTVLYLQDILNRAGVSTKRVRKKDQLSDTEIFVPMQQPYGSFAKALLEKQEYPHLTDSAGNPIAPYDVTAHTLSLLMDINETPLFQNARMSFDDGELALHRGPFRDCKKEFAYGLYRSENPSMDEGWTRWVFKEFDWMIPAGDSPCDKNIFSIQRIGNGPIKQGVPAMVRVLIFPDQPANQILNGYPKGSMPDEYVGGVGKEGVENLKKFVEAGGTLVFLNRSSNFAIQQFNLPVNDVTQGLARKDFYIPGSILRTELNTTSSMGQKIAKGMPKESIAWFEGSPAFEPRGNSSEQNYFAIAKYPKDPKSILLSGWALGVEKIAGKDALVIYAMGKGKIVLFGFRPQYRGQSLATFPLLFNAISN